MHYQENLHASLTFEKDSQYCWYFDDQDGKKGSSYGCHDFLHIASGWEEFGFQTRLTSQNSFPIACHKVPDQVQHSAKHKNLLRSVGCYSIKHIMMKLMETYLHNVKKEASGLPLLKPDLTFVWNLKLRVGQREKCYPLLSFKRPSDTPLCVVWAWTSDPYDAKQSVSDRKLHPNYYCGGGGGALTWEMHKQCHFLLPKGGAQFLGLEGTKTWRNRLYWH